MIDEIGDILCLTELEQKEMKERMEFFENLSKGGK